MAKVDKANVVREYLADVGRREAKPVDAEMAFVRASFTVRRGI